MVVLKVSPWTTEGIDSPTAPPSIDKVVLSQSGTDSTFLFGFQDLTSDYIQVLCENARPRWCKIVWWILTGILMAFTVFMAYELLSEYFEYESFIKCTIKWDKQLVLPAITVCSTNFINYTALKTDLTRYGDTGEFKYIVTQIRKEVAWGRDPSKLKLLEEYKSVIAFEKSVGSIDFKYANHLHGTFVGEFDYTFAGNGNIIAPYEWDKLQGMTYLGKCLEINDLKQFHQTYNSDSAGLTVDVSANVEDYLFSTRTKGFKVFIRNHDETVMMDRGGSLVQPGTETFFKIYAKRERRLGNPWGTCQNVPSAYSKFGSDSDPHYETVRECRQRQRIELYAARCGCLPWYFVSRMEIQAKHTVLDELIGRMGQGNTTERQDRKRKHIPSQRVPDKRHGGTGIKTAEGGTDDAIPTLKPPPPFWSQNSRYKNSTCAYVELLICEAYIEEEISKGRITLENCPEPCEYWEWDTQVETSSFPPSEEFYNEHIKHDWYIEANTSYNYARGNFARIHIYYDDLKTTTNEQVKAYEIQNFIAEFGGTVDLFIGFSFFTVFQLIKISIAFCFYRWRHRGKSGTSVTTSTVEAALGVIPEKIQNEQLKPVPFEPYPHQLEKKELKEPQKAEYTYLDLLLHCLKAWFSKY